MDMNATVSLAEVLVTVVADAKSVPFNKRFSGKIEY